MNNLYQYGWNDHLNSLKQSSPFHLLAHGRIGIVHKTCYEVIAEDNTYLCELSGNLLYTREPSDYPGTGDWILFNPTDQEKGIILDILPRERAIFRKRVGSESKKQLIASWLDKAFVVQSLDQNFNVRRVERMIVQIRSEDIRPALVLTKSDLGFNINEAKKALAHLENLPVYFTSKDDPDSLTLLKSSIHPCETIVFLGSSGVGKSTLINALCGEEKLYTREISEWSGKGKHTSTRREMILLKDGGILIDTPGIREFGLTLNDTESIGEVLQISELEKHCQFSDCTHSHEPGCAVLKARKENKISQEQFDSYHKLRKEAWHFSASEHEKRRKEKAFSGMVKEVMKLKNNPSK